MSHLLNEVRDARACYVMAHGAGAGMTHPFLASVADNLAAHSISTFRYNFPYMEARSRRPDSPAVAQAAVRAAVAEAARLTPGVPLFAGGKSFGGRMTSQAQAESPLPGVRGLIFLGFPLHPPGKPSIDRAKHLDKIEIPMLFLQGSRDEFGQLDLLQPLIARLGSRATLHLFSDADHSFKAPKKSGRDDAQTRSEIAAVVAAWIDGVLKL
jgi:predicted alpha/beta-hydrolase family hydrolase